MRLVCRLIIATLAMVWASCGGEVERRAGARVEATGVPQGALLAQDRSPAEPSKEDPDVDDPDDGKREFFEGPEGATEADLRKAAQVIIARCTMSGSRRPDLTAEILRRGGRLLIAFTSERDSRTLSSVPIGEFDKVPDIKIEIRFERNLLPEEADEYRPGNPPEQGRAPKGTRWFIFKQDEAVLLRDEPVVTRADFAQFEWSEDDRELTCKVSTSMMERIRAEKLRSNHHRAFLLVDGRIESGVMSWQSHRVDKETGEASPIEPPVFRFIRRAGWCIQHPLPLRVEEANRPEMLTLRVQALVEAVRRGDKAKLTELARAFVLPRKSRWFVELFGGVIGRLQRYGYEEIAQDQEIARFIETRIREGSVELRLDRFEKFKRSETGEVRELDKLMKATVRTRQKITKAIPASQPILLSWSTRGEFGRSSHFLKAL